MAESELVVPRHVGFIMDGNGRWAKKRGMPRNYGHDKGADVIEEVVGACRDLGVKTVSLYAFSTENWSRPKDEVDKIFELLHKFLKRYTHKLIRDKIRLIISGDLEAIPEDLKNECLSLIERTKDFPEFSLNIAINYGSRAEIVRAVNRLIDGHFTSVTEKDIERELYTSTIPDIDLVVRTSGEQRLSNFFMWQCAYAELYFTDVLWPDFHKEELKKAIEWFSGRKRRFGGI
ncbi:MAG: di-trans,poly-cis-decaprenylcistransferase [Clostridia bacterium]|nr:di-trans,poly-cis-decaprenylcistransferase [Clostridia bacterium]MBR1675935.1 di-trans,poly-cis-decaprenylcistransferase [Clostridia bacterium]